MAAFDCRKDLMLDITFWMLASETPLLQPTGKALPHDCDDDKSAAAATTPGSPSVHQPPARFDSGYPLYYEDMDLCRRLQAAGSPVLWLPQPVLGHQRGEGSSTPSSRRLELSTRSYCRYLRLHCSGWVRALRLVRLVARAVLSLAFQPQKGWAVLRGIRVCD